MKTTPWQDSHWSYGFAWIPMDWISGLTVNFTFSYKIIKLVYGVRIIRLTSNLMLRVLPFRSLDPSCPMICGVLSGPQQLIYTPSMYKIIFFYYWVGITVLKWLNQPYICIYYSSSYSAHLTGLTTCINYTRKISKKAKILRERERRDIVLPKLPGFNPVNPGHATFRHPWALSPHPRSATLAQRGSKYSHL